MGLYSSFKTSPKLEKEGIWRDFGHCRILLARAGGSNQKYNIIMEKYGKDNLRALQAGLIGNDKAMGMLHDAYTNSVILAWETNVSGDDANPQWEPGIENPDGSGNLLPFNNENVKATLKALPDLFMELKATAENQQFYLASIIEGAVKN